MKQKLYLETTIPSYLTSWPSRDLIIAANQQITKEWWQRRKDDFQIFVSELVIEECASGDSKVAEERLKIVGGFVSLDVTEQADDIAIDLVQKKILPVKARADALHIAIAAVNGIDYLLTWNCKHIANAEIYFHVRQYIELLGWKSPVICTPAELTGE